jgi:multidrug resistance efflux pump
MSDVELKARAEPAANVGLDEPPPRAPGRARRHIQPFFVTLVTAATAAAVGWAMWDAYMGAPWTRDGTVRAYVVTMAPQVAGQIVKLPIVDNQFVHKGDLLLEIDPTDYRIAVELAQAAAERAQTAAYNAEREAQRRQELTRLAVTKEEKQTYESDAVAAAAAYQVALANLNQARVNLQRTEIRSPANGYVTNLLAQLGDYANVGENLISLVDADSYWVDGYFEETNLSGIHKGDPATVKLMGYPQLVQGHVHSIARAISSPTRNPMGRGWPRSTRSSPGCAWRSASRSVFISIKCPRASSCPPG